VNKILIGLLMLGSGSVFAQNDLTKTAVEQNATVIEEYQVFLEGQTRRKCNFKDKSWALVNAFKGITYPSRVYNCGTKEMTFTFECKGDEIEEKCKIKKVVIK
jgi:hypothetical protein